MGAGLLAIKLVFMSQSLTRGKRESGQISIIVLCLEEGGCDHVIESLINTRTLKKRCALAERTEVKQTQEL